MISNFINFRSHTGTTFSSLLCASQHFVKVISTYRNRKEEKRYSKRILLGELSENEYNLNLPRYIDTSEEMEEIAIALVSKQLKDIEIEIKQTGARLLAYCNELQIDTPF